MTKLKNFSPIVIIGSGPAAFTASLYLGRAKIHHKMIAGNQKGGQLINTLEVDNYPGISSVDGFSLMSMLEQHALKFGGELIDDTIADVNFTQKPFVLTGEKQIYHASAVIIATGSSPRVLNLPKEQDLLGRGVSYCATCDGSFFKNQIVSVVGGGNVATEEALYLSNLAKKVYLIHRRGILTSEKILQDKVFSKSNIEVLWNSTIHRLGSNNQGLEKLTIFDKLQNISYSLKVDGLFIAIGHTPNTKFLKSELNVDKSGYIITKNKSTVTSVPGVFAAGDVQDQVYRQAITSAANGCMAALDAISYFNLMSS